MVLAGETDAAIVRRAREEAWRIIAADGGVNALHALDVAPSEVVGDMDSARADALAWAERAGARVERAPREKDETDGQLAVDRALAARATEIAFTGVTGGRLDHVLANLQVLRRAAERGARVAAWETIGEIHVVTREHPLDLALPPGRVVSVLALTDVATGVTLHGLAYPLTGARLDAATPLGASNVARAGRQRVECASGVLAVVVPRAG